ncbi:Kinase, CAMK CAMK1 [Spironucleus salmonicida]|uniref:Kinase, CAMK CAMK1 n=1 Tax=Spironucleus salmonicida TaxID=348837 RepID=V6LXH1_9EUKA|nr:Kinase, CAMK CAMK1 [Spironucleus salmonicida]|eukprot:EST45519.1 Kinase, CAMK CAMK1 [Spironucleus salmonicida]
MSISDKYTLTDKVLGKGSFGECILGIDKETNKEVAIKIIKQQGANMQMLVREISVLKRCDHENIIKFFGFFEENGNIYLVTELAKGGELFDHIVRRRNYSELDSKALVRQILSALCYLHSNNVAHLDLKPENLLLKEVPENYDEKHYMPLIKLADFGTCQMFGNEESLQKVLCGTPGYVAPEVLLQKKFTVQPDMYSVGVITYVLLAGQLPFDDRDIKKMIRKQIKGDWHFTKIFDEISPDARDFISKLMDLDHTKRPTAFEAIKHPWIVTEVNTVQLTQSKTEMRKYLAKLRLRAGFATVAAAARFAQME